ncbi:MAG: hypothetical protein ABJA34_06740 [Pseudonocardiales bacterium]
MSAANRQFRDAVRLARPTGDLYLVALMLDSLAYAEWTNITVITGRSAAWGASGSGGAGVGPRC